MKKNYINPVLFADYSDPDVIPVGDLFLLTASSFNYTPGLPILLSRDLTEWTLVDHAVENLGEGFENPRHSQGVWAPSVRYFHERLHIYYGMPDEGLFVVRSSRFRQEEIKTYEDYEQNVRWEKPVCVLAGKGLIDPCPFMEEDGRLFLIHAYAKSRIGFKSILGMCELSGDGLRAVSADHFIVNGNLVDASMRENRNLLFAGGVGEKPDEHTAPAVTMEGPKVMKRGGFYYILAPAGGVTRGYQLCLRAQKLQGPYECRVILHQGDTIINGPHQGALVETKAGEEFFLHFQDLGPYGRVCHLQPVTWKEGWPVFGETKDNDTCGIPVRGGCVEVTEPAKKDPFADRLYELNTYLNGTARTDSYDSLVRGGKIDLHWQWMGDHRTDFYRIDVPVETGEGEADLYLRALNVTGSADPVLWNCSNVLTRKLDLPEFAFDLCMDVRNLLPGDRAGLMMTGGQYAFAECIREEDGTFTLRAGKSLGGDQDKRESFCPLQEKIDPKDLQDGCIRFSLQYHRTSGEPLSTYMNVREEKPVAVFSCSTDKGATSCPAGEPFIPQDHTWVGAKIGIYAVSHKKEGGWIRIVSTSATR